MASFLFNTGNEKIHNQTLDWVTGDVRVLLLKSSTPDKDYDVVNDLTPGTNELTVAGYGRVACTSEAITRDDTNDWVKFVVADVAFGALTVGETITWAIFYKYNASDASAQLIAAIDVADTATNGGTVTLTIHANGVFYVAS